MKVRLAIPNAAPYPHSAVLAGLRRFGVEVTTGDQHDWLLTWSPWLGSHRDALVRQAHRNNAAVVVLENGWLSPIGGVPYYQIALGGWNGQGRFFPGDGSRWRSWGLPIWPWRGAGNKALVVGQRGHPSDRRTAPPRWHETVDIPEPWEVTRRGRDAREDFFVQLALTDRVVVWSSNAASWAIVHGVPVHYLGPTLMVAECAAFGLGLDHPVTPERQPALERLAWAQWTAAEIESGEPFARLGLGTDRATRSAGLHAEPLSAPGLLHQAEPVSPARLD